MKHLFTAVSMVVSTAAIAQNGNIKGQFLDNSKIEVIGAEVTLKKDGATVISTFTDVNGRFEFSELSNGNYVVQFSYIGLKDYTKSVTIDNDTINLGSITIDKSSIKLDDVIIVGDVIAAKQSGDTSQFNANAYKVNPDATTEDLIRKMPGIDLSEGTPKAQGENITKVLVDGKPFFGDDVNATLKNLPAEVVSGIQIYDERSEQSQMSGFDDGNTTKTLNIITRVDKRQGVFGKAYAGYGLGNGDGNNGDAYHNLGTTLNYFKGNRKVTLMGQMNNINIQNFGSQDLGGNTRGPGGGAQAGGPGGSSDFRISQRGGINTTNAMGLNYVNSWKDKLQLSASYFYNNSKNNSVQDLVRDYVSSKLSGQHNEENTRSYSNEVSHRLNARLEYQIDSSNYLMFSPSLRIQNSLGNSLTNTNMYLNELPITQSSNGLNTKLNAINADYRLLYNHKFKKEGRTISLSNNSSWNNSDGQNNLDAYSIYEDTTNNINTYQQSELVSKGWSTYANLNYTEPLTKVYKMQANAGLRYQLSESDKKTYDRDASTGNYDILNTVLSNEFQSTYTTYFGGLALAYVKNKINWNVGANAQNAILENQRFLPIAGELNRNFNNLLPYAAFTYDIAKGSSIRVRYNTSTNTPSVNQLQDVLDNSNTQILRRGNADLKQNYQHRVFANYRTSNAKNNSNFFVMVMGQFTNDYVGNSTTIATDEMTVDGITLQKGMQYIKPINLDGYHRLFTHGSYGFRIKPIKSNLNLNGMISSTRTPGLINGEKNFANSMMYGFGATLSSNISENIDFTIGSQTNYSNVINTLNTTANNQFLNQSSRLDLNYIFGQRFFINTQLNHQYYTGLNDNFNQNYLLWNAAAGVKFLKGNAAEIKLSMYDILNQNQAISRTFNDIYTQTSITNVLQQYFMLTFTYNIRYFKGQSTEKDFQSGNERGGMMSPGRMEGLPPGPPPAGM